MHFQRDARISRLGLALFLVIGLSIAATLGATPAELSATDFSKAIANPAQIAGTTLYETSFEPPVFTTGLIVGQDNWADFEDEWFIDTTQPLTGAQHVLGLASGDGDLQLFSTGLVGGVEPFSCSTMNIFLNRTSTDSTWEVVPQSFTAGFINTRVRINPDGTIDAGVNIGGGQFVPTGTSWVFDQYNEFGISVDRTTFDFRLFLNGTEFFSGPGFAGTVEQVVFNGSFAGSSTTDQMLIDDFTILDCADGDLGGPPPNPLEVPTLGQGGLTALALLLAAAALFMVRRRA
ncbi:MAG: IPTL-CTERM sorting domain-containing protein [Acidobacteriota bacterium]